MEVIKNKRILAIIGIAGLLLGCFLPYYTITLFGYTKSVSLFNYWEGWVVLVLTFANALFIFQDFIEKYVPQLFNNLIGVIVKKLKNPKFALIPTILVAVFAISLIIRLDVDSEYIKHGFGFWILWVGIIALIGHAIFYKNQSSLLAEQLQSNDFQPQQQVSQFNNQSVQQPQTFDNLAVGQSQNIGNPVIQQPTQQPFQVNQQTVQTEHAKKYCPQCGNHLDSSVETCFICGHKF